MPTTPTSGLEPLSPVLGDNSVLVLDGNAASRTWTLTADAEQRVREATPEDWELRVMRSATSSDGDGATPPTDEVLHAIADAEIYVGFGISRPEHVRSIGQWAGAAVVGSALVKVIAEHGQSAGLLDEVERYVRWLRN